MESAYGLLFYGQYDGAVAYNWTNGQVAWRYSAPALPFETPYTNGTGNLNCETYTFFTGGIIANGILYTWSVEHSPTAPLKRGSSLFAINATTGALIWSTLGPMDPGVVSGGYMTATNMYDGYMYVFGMGLSATTVSAPQTQITQGTSTIISGTVLDQSPAQPGTPAVSRNSMGDWMAYLYQQAPYPTNLTGVPVSIDAVDPNGNPSTHRYSNKQHTRHLWLHMDSNNSRPVHDNRNICRRRLIRLLIGRYLRNRRCSNNHTNTNSNHTTIKPCNHSRLNDLHRPRGNRYNNRNRNSRCFNIKKKK